MTNIFNDDLQTTIYSINNQTDIRIKWVNSIQKESLQEPTEERIEEMGRTAVSIIIQNPFQIHNQVNPTKLTWNTYSV